MYRYGYIHAPKNGEIALWPNTSVVEYKFISHERHFFTKMRALGYIC